MLYKRGKVWWLKIRRKGKLIRKSTGTCSKELARKIEINVLNALVEGKWFGIDTRKKTLKEMIEKYDSEYSSRKKISGKG